MHADEVPIDTALVRRLVDGQHPRWAGLPLAPVPSSGTDHALYRLGEDLCVRLPRIHWAAGQVGKEQRWLPVLAPGLPLPVPEPVAAGEPAEGYPWRWSVYRWLPGVPGNDAVPADPVALATDLAAFVTALHGLDATGGPPPGDHNFGRGRPLAERAEFTADAIYRCAGLLDAAAVTSTWEADLAAPAWDGPPVWVHGDLAPSNLLLTGGRLSAVIDFGGLGVGDPAVDLMVAWTMFDGAAREAYRAALAVDDATWARGRGWALSVALVALPYYLETNPLQVALSRRAIAEVLADHG